ncbi:MAG: ABC transporter permease [Gemmataceae bacterium]
MEQGIMGLAPETVEKTLVAAEKSAETSAEEPGVTVLGPPRGWQLINFRELWQFRDLLYFLTWRDVKIRYKQTVLGAAWAVLQPALMMVVFTIFFGRLAAVDTGDVPYPLFVYAGLLPWTFFATAIGNGGNSVVGSERLITKIYFPRLAIPFAAVGAAMVDFAVAFALMVLLMLAYGVMPTAALLLVPVIFFLILLAATGVGTLLAALNVAYRDFRYVIPFLVQLWMFATPSIYLDLDSMPAEKFSSPFVQTLLFANPMTDLIAAFRAALLGGPIPWEMLLYAAPLCLVVFLLGCLYFRKVEDTFADVI